MLTVRAILHPTNFSDLADNAFRLACELALDYHAPLHVLHVATAFEAYEKEVVGNRHSAQYLAADWARLREYRWPGVEIRHILEEGDAAEQIILAAQSIPCDFIVMSSHGRSGLPRLLLGSVAENVLREATCQVIIVKAPVAAADTPPVETKNLVQAADPLRLGVRAGDKG
jgi:nucleotide-binding universal stress UspA family protein